MYVNFMIQKPESSVKFILFFQLEFQISHLFLQKLFQAHMHMPRMNFIIQIPKYIIPFSESEFYIFTYFLKNTIPEINHINGLSLQYLYLFIFIMDLKNLRPTQILSLKEIVVGNYETDSQDTEVKNQAYLSEQSIIQLENQCDDDNKLIRTVSRKRLSLNDLINRCESDSNKRNSYNENKKHNSLNFELPHQFNDQQIKAKVGNSPLKCEKLLQNQPKLQKFPQQQQLNKLKNSYNIKNQVVLVVEKVLYLVKIQQENYQIISKMIQAKIKKNHRIDYFQMPLIAFLDFIVYFDLKQFFR